METGAKGVGFAEAAHQRVNFSKESVVPRVLPSCSRKSLVFNRHRAQSCRIVGGGGAPILRPSTLSPGGLSLKVT